MVLSEGVRNRCSLTLCRFTVPYILRGFPLLLFLPLPPTFPLFCAVSIGPSKSNSSNPSNKLSKLSPPASPTLTLSRDGIAAAPCPGRTKSHILRLPPSAGALGSASVEGETRERRADRSRRAFFRAAAVRAAVVGLERLREVGSSVSEWKFSSPSSW